MQRFYTILIINIVVAINVLAQDFTMAQSPFQSAITPKREVRAMWLTTIGGLDWPHSYASSERSIAKQKQELITILDRLRDAGINTVLMQTRVRATTIYPSNYEPWDGCLSGKPGVSPGYDALQFAIDECHKRGMELHAWVVTIPIGKWNGKGCASLRAKHPELVKKIGEDGYMNPEAAGTGRYIADICEEITRRYDIDGIHLDYIRYPETWKQTVSKTKGREYITSIARTVSNRVKNLKPWVKMSCSPIGKYNDLPRQWSHGWNAYTAVCQDAQGWLRDGIMDALFPMMYFRDQNFFPFALDWKENSYGRIVCPGLGIYFMSPKEKNWDLKVITQEMQVLRQWGMGHCYFRSQFFTSNLKGLYDFAAKDFDSYLALPDAMTWMGHPAPLPPTQVMVDTLSQTLSWSGAVDRSDAPYLMYNIYTSQDYPVDTDNAANLLIMRLPATQCRVPLLVGRNYAITAIDRYGNESAPVMVGRKKMEKRKIRRPDQLPSPKYPFRGRKI